MGRASCLWGPSFPQRLQKVVTCPSGSHGRPLLRPPPGPSQPATDGVSQGVPSSPSCQGRGLVPLAPPFSSPREDLPCGSADRRAVHRGSLSPRRTGRPSVSIVLQASRAPGPVGGHRAGPPGTGGRQASSACPCSTESRPVPKGVLSLHPRQDGLKQGLRLLTGRAETPVTPGTGSRQNRPTDLGAKAK